MSLPSASAHFLKFQQFSGAVPRVGGNAKPYLTDILRTVKRKEVASKIALFWHAHGMEV